MKRKKRERMGTALSQTNCAIDSMNGIEKYVKRYHECCFNPYDSSCKGPGHCEFYHAYEDSKVCLLDDTLGGLKIFKLRLEGLLG